MKIVGILILLMLSYMIGYNSGYNNAYDWATQMQQLLCTQQLNAQKE